jgi:hypothetical protein
MSTTVQNAIDFAQPFVEYIPPSAGNNNNPALSIANMIQNMVTSPPFTWGWNRNEDHATSTVAGTQDYVCALTDFGFLEKITLKDTNGNLYDVSDIYNTAALGIGNATTAKCARPNSAAVISVTYGTSFKLRFLAVPDAVYVVYQTYQKLVTPMAALTGTPGTWTIPDQYQDIYFNLFLGEIMAFADDARSQLYRQRGVLSLLAKAEGLSELQKNLFLEQFWARAGQQQQTALVRQQAQQARGV